ncbi:hypothetical protein B0A49_05906 [Cryomyces minteri]|uniref:Cell surface mannoprotein MP65 n=1 Tax=Cryomyces minteri TaxID=331657 RepID=A0A4U0WUK7_9PEZI|nr:hypothetical protein B0A49_05906 [Cryomyces minteri]
MKAGIFCVAAAIACELVAAQPHRRHHHAKRDVVTEISYVTATAADVIVYVDESGKPLYTSFANQAAPTSKAPASSSASSVAAAAPTTSASPTTTPVAQSSAAAPTTPTTSAHATPASSSVAPVSSSAAPVASSASSSAAPAASSSTSSSSGHGISYSPYNADGTCKDQATVSSDFAKINGYSMVRIYGTDCNQVSTVLTAAKAKGMKIFAGIFNIAQVSAEVQTLISAASGSWDVFDTISIGNEAVNAGTASVSAVVSAIGTARTLLGAAGYKGHIVTVDTFVALINHPELCKASDYAAANAHAFFDGNVEAAGAGAFVLSQAQRVSAACGGMNTVITETGWPSQGGSNNKAVPSVANQQAAIASLKSTFSSNIILFTAFNDLWKKDNAGTFGCEKYWGMIN